MMVLDSARGSTRPQHYSFRIAAYFSSKLIYGQKVCGTKQAVGIAVSYNGREGVVDGIYPSPITSPIVACYSVRCSKDVLERLT
jgi:hypothetical protein